MQPAGEEQVVEDEQESGNAGEDRWLLTYSDMITLLLAFFIILYAMAQGSSKTNNVLIVEAMHAAFHTPMPMGLTQKSANTMTPLSKVVAPPQQQSKQTTGPQKLVMSNQMQQIASALTADLHRANVPPSAVAVKATASEVDITFGSNVYFQSARATVLSPFEKVLKIVAPVLRTVPYEMEVQGYTNNLPLYSTKYQTAWELAGARAINVLRFLTETQGVSPYHMEAVSFGQWHPRWPNNSPSNLAKNRSVDIVITDMTPPGINDGGPDTMPQGQIPSWQ